MLYICGVEPHLQLYHRFASPFSPFGLFSLFAGNSVCFFVGKRTDIQLPFARWANGKQIKENQLGFHYTFLFSVSMSPCLCLHVQVSMSPCVHFYVSMSMSACFHVSISMSPCLHVSKSISPGFRNSENWKRINGKWQPFVFCKQKMETVNFRLFAANGNGKRMFVFLGR